MILQASYDELNDIISEKAEIKGLTLNYCDTDTTKVTFMLNILGLTPTISVKLKVISIEGTRVTAEVSAGKVGDFVLDKAKKFLMEKNFKAALLALAVPAILASCAREIEKPEEKPQDPVEVSEGHPVTISAAGDNYKFNWSPTNNYVPGKVYKVADKTFIATSAAQSLPR